MRILIGTDGSDYSKAAVTECCNLLIHSGNTEILIMSAYEDSYPVMAEPFAISSEYYKQLESKVKNEAASFVEDAKRIISTHFPMAEVTIETEVVRGPPDQQIIEKATQWKADIIVVGSHGRGFWGRLLGSVSDGVVHHAPCSVMVVRKPKN